MMHVQSVSRRPVILAGVLALVLSSLVLGSLSHAQVVQLPSVRNFSYSGSVWAPDQGTTSLGGSGYTRSSIVGRGMGPYAGRAIGGGAGRSSISASVQIIDLKALDDAILNANVKRDPSAPAVLSADSPAAGGGRQFLSGLVSEVDQALEPRDARELRPDANRWHRVMKGSGNTARPQNESLVEADIRYYLRQGKAAEQANSVMAARVYYRMAIEAMTPEMTQRYHRILAERKATGKEKRNANQPTRVKF